MEPLTAITYLCIAMTQLWISTGCTNDKFRMLMYYLWFAGSVVGLSMMFFK